VWAKASKSLKDGRIFRDIRDLVLAGTPISFYLTV
jgi:hypothetical protein